ncbi:MAG: hypothetical protein WCY19_03175 [Candidatus Gastranaerophilaceae bacterium]
MNNTEHKKLADITIQLTSMTYLLKVYCEYFEDDITEFAKLSEFATILDKTGNLLFDLL